MKTAIQRGIFRLIPVSIKEPSIFHFGVVYIL
uniref:Uncharacterized protein n=1 Tax=Arundo donax TaxID=35708 RepID=A0A0A9BMV2_ARUDO